MRGKFKLSVTSAVLLLLLGLTSHTVIAKLPSLEKLQIPLLETRYPDRSENWLTYTDPKYGISLQYPENWQVVSDFDEAVIGSTLTLSLSNCNPINTTSEQCALEESPPFKVEIGMSLVAWENERPLNSWLAKYNQMSSISESSTENIKRSQEVIVDDQLAIMEEGESTVTKYKYVIIPRGNIVWFIWTNVDEANEPVFDRMVASFEFSKRSPTTLQEVYGENFQPFSIDTKVSTSVSRAPGLAKRNSSFSYLGYDWTVPMRGYYTVGCDSAWHTGSAAYAVDVSASTGTNTYSAHDGDVIFMGYGWNDGYGNLVKIQSGNYVAYYAHLSGIDAVNIIEYPPYGGLLRGQQLGWMGNTGNSTGPHLHFHIRTTNWSPVNLTGMLGFYPNANYPSCCVCGYMSYY